MEINKNLNIVLNENSCVRKHTKEEEIKDFTIEAPVINLLPFDIIKDNFYVNNLNGSYTIDNEIIHFDFHTMPYTARKCLFNLRNVQNLCELSEGTYTLTFELYNIKGSQPLTGINCYRYYRVLGNNADSSANIGLLNARQGGDGVFSLTFDVLENEITTNFYIGIDFWAWVSNGRDLSFDFRFIGLVKGTKPLIRANNFFIEAPQIHITNSENIIGKYKISNNIRRHLTQIERHIMSKEGLFDVKLRNR